jgi:hypothetical protein
VPPLSASGSKHHQNWEQQQEEAAEITHRHRL